MTTSKKKITTPRRQTRLAPPPLRRVTNSKPPPSVRQSLVNRFPSGSQKFVGRNSRDSLVQDEFIRDVESSVDFATTSIPFNPGQSTFLPRFSREAVLYEKWICILAEVYYKPMVSAFSTNGQTGKVMLSFDYDASDAPPTTKQQVEDSDPHSDGMPYEEVRLRLDPRYLNSGSDGKYVRPGGLPGSADIKNYDGGIIRVSTIGAASSGTIGELRCRYHFRLLKPVLDSPAAPLQYHVSSFVRQADQSIPSGVINPPTVLDYDTIQVNGIGATVSVGSCRLPSGNYTFGFAATFYFASSNGAGAVVYLYRNGSPFSTTARIQTTGATIQEYTGSNTCYGTSDGATVFDIRVHAVFASGVCNVLGHLLITSI